MYDSDSKLVTGGGGPTYIYIYFSVLDPMPIHLIYTFFNASISFQFSFCNDLFWTFFTCPKNSRLVSRAFYNDK